jgi:hypothetical protein
MKSTIKHSFIVFTLSITLGCAGTPGDETHGLSESGSRRGDCIHEPSIRGYSILDEQNLIVEAAGRRKYHVELMRRAIGLRSSMGIAFYSSMSRICGGFSDIVFDGQFDGESIRIKSIRELSPDELEAILIDFGKLEPEIRSAPVPQDVRGADVEELDVDDDE